MPDRKERKGRVFI